MIFGKCHLKIVNFMPRLDEDAHTSGHNFSIGLRKQFARRALDNKLPEKGLENFQKIGEDIVLKLFRTTGSIISPYEFFKHESGKKSSLINSVNVPGTNGCYLLAQQTKLKELDQIDEHNLYLEYNPHNIDTVTQAYALLSLFTYWEDTMECVLRQ